MIESANVWIVLGVTIVVGIIVPDLILRRVGYRMSRPTRTFLRNAFLTSSWGVVVAVMTYFYFENNYLGVFAAAFGAAILYVRKMFAWFYDRYDRFVDTWAEGEKNCPED